MFSSRWAPLLTLILAGCASVQQPVGQPPLPTPEVTPDPAPVSPRPTVPTPTGTSAPQPSPSPAADPRWRFFDDDQSTYGSPWYQGRHRVMIGFGCTPAPYYRRDPRCPGRQGFHHGIDIAIPCGIPVYAGDSGRIVTGGVGAAYGSKAFRIRTSGADLLIAHTRRVLVSDGQWVEAGTPIAEIGDLGAPDGCHLHLEQRTVGGSVTSASNPSAVLALAR